jgi:acetyl-CoA acetyltransferase
VSSLGGKAAIAGIGQTEFSKESGRSELQPACEAVKAAIDDAGLRPIDIDGMVMFTMDANEEIEVARSVGIGDLTFFTRVPHGGGAVAGTVVQAAMAVATGTADAVVCYRAFNDRSGFRFGGSTARSSGETPLWLAPYAPFGLLTPAAWVGLHAQRYMSTYGVTNEDFGRISVVDRAHAARNPDAWFYQRPITIEDHQKSRWVIEPVLRLLDCCQESDGGVAIVVTTVERARDLPRPPAVITAAVQGAAHDGEVMTSCYRDDITGLPQMGRGRQKALARFRTQTHRYPNRIPLRPLHSVRIRATRGAGVLRPRRGQRLRDRREALARWAAADQHERRSAR